MAKSGIDSLIEALKASGADVDGKFSSDGSSSEAGSSSTSAGKTSSSSSASSTSSKTSSSSSSSNARRQQQPFSEIPKAILESPVVDKVKNWSRRGKILGCLVILIILGIAYWWFHPPINIQSETTWIIVLVLVVLPLFFFFRSRKNKYAPNGFGKKKDKNKEKKAEANAKAEDKNLVKDIMEGEDLKKAKKYRKLCWIPLAVIVIGLIGMLLSATFFPGNAQKYANILQTQDLDFKNDIQEVNYNQIPIIDRDTARVLGTKEMGTIPDYVSQFEISNLYSQINYKQKPVRVSPLGYADLFKWLTNREQGIPAYCLIDMATQDASIVRIAETTGSDGQGIKYSESEPLARNIHRYIQLKYPFYMFDEFSFEIDEDGHPWWICPVQKKTIGLFGGTTIERVILCDAVTGECTDMDVSEVPQWVDRVYPSELLLTQYNWSGKYKKGWLNSWIGQSGVVKTTPASSTSSSSSSSSSTSKNLGYNYIAKDDDVWVYTGVTSATSDTSIVGFILINQRNAESHFYSISGATESAAMESAEGQVQQMRYTATFPILINVANQPTYFIALKDGAGLVKKFAMIDIQRYQTVAIGDSVAECQKNYKQLLTKNGIALTASESGTTNNQASGVISNMMQAVIDGNSHIYVTLAGDTKIYDFTMPNQIGIVKYKVGDNISFEFNESDDLRIVTEIK